MRLFADRKVSVKNLTCQGGEKRCHVSVCKSFDLVAWKMRFVWVQKALMG